MKEAIVEIKNVGKTYGKKEVIKEISMEVFQGEIVALLGHNGAGKSTLIKMLTGLITKSKGSIKIFGEEISPFQKQGKNHFSYLPEIMSLFPHLTAKETLHFFASLQKIPEKREDEVLELVGLTEFKNEKVGSFSKGMTQRIGFAIALLPKAPILILDEPTTGLDSYWSIQFKKMMRYLNDEGTTILFASHILSEVEDLADRVGIMSEGDIIALGTIPELKQEVSDEVQIKALFSKEIRVIDLHNELQAEVTKQKNSYFISCKQHEKMKVLKKLHNMNHLLDFEVKEMSLEDIYQRILLSRYEGK